MPLNCVTITGADDQTDIDKILDLSAEYPFVEWGILVSASRIGSERFPSMDWIYRLEQAIKGTKTKLSLHLCGMYVRSLLAGTYHDDLVAREFRMFDRVQLNFHREVIAVDERKFYESLTQFGPRQIIFQMDGAKGKSYMDSLSAGYDTGIGHVDAVPLFDASGGAGVSPTEWPTPEYLDDDTTYCYHGYAGGLGPDNLSYEIPNILRVAGERCPRIWVDMETKVCTNTGNGLDFDAVEKCLQIAKSFIAVPS